MSWTSQQGVVADTSIDAPERFGEYATENRARERTVFERWANAFIGACVCDCHPLTFIEGDPYWVEDECTEDGCTVRPRHLNHLPIGGA